MLYEKAFNRFAYALLKNHNKLFDFYLKDFDNSKVTGKLFWKIVKALEDLEVEVKLVNDLGIRNDVNNEPFNIAGLWDQPNRLVSLSSLSYGVLIHEFAHVVDARLQRKTIFGMECELVASAASYIFVCERLGFFSPKQDIKYVKRYGATIENLKNLKQRVMDVFWNMHFLAR